MEILNMYTELQNTESRLRKACSQIILLNARLEETKGRYDKAIKDNLRSNRCLLRTRIVTLEGMINMYYEYILKKQDDAIQLRQKLFGPDTDTLVLTGNDVTGDDLLLSP